MAKNEVKVKVIVSDDGTLALTKKVLKNWAKKLIHLGAKYRKVIGTGRVLVSSLRMLLKTFQKCNRLLGLVLYLLMPH